MNIIDGLLTIQPLDHSAHGSSINKHFIRELRLGGTCGFSNESDDAPSITFAKRNHNPKIPPDESKMFFNERPGAASLLDTEYVRTPNIFTQEFDFPF
jgi:hypothetical protein